MQISNCNYILTSYPKYSVKQKIFIFISLLLSFNFLKAHSDFRTFSRAKNVITCIKTGYNFEEIKKIELIGNIVAGLSEKLEYKGVILIIYNHNYIRSEITDYYMSIDKGKYDYNDNSHYGRELLKDSSIVLKCIGSKISSTDILKCVEYAILNEKEIKKDQVFYNCNKEFEKPKILSIDSNKIKEIILSKSSNTIAQLQRIPIYRKEVTQNTPNISYFYKENKYHIYKTEPNSKDSTLLILDDIFQFERFRQDNTVIVFDSDTTFYRVCMYGPNKLVSKKLTIENKIRTSYKPYILNYIGFDKFSIAFEYVSVVNNIYETLYRTLVYNENTETLLQDLEKCMENGK